MFLDENEYLTYQNVMSCLEMFKKCLKIQKLSSFRSTIVSSSRVLKNNRKAATEQIKSDGTLNNCHPVEVSASSSLILWRAIFWNEIMKKTCDGSNKHFRYNYISFRFLFYFQYLGNDFWKSHRLCAVIRPRFLKGLNPIKLKLRKISFIPS